MKNLKKVLALVVVFAMMLSTVAFAGTFKDVADDAAYAGAVETLASLGYFLGDENGNFNPDATITRAEYATIVCRLLGIADSATGKADFADVAADHWATSYIKMANQFGIVAGYGDGNFGPEDTVKYEEAVKMLVCALGYEPMALSKGGWPTGYVATASQIGLLDGIYGAAEGAGASRATVAMMTYNALDIPVMEQVGFGTEISYEIMKETNEHDKKTLLTNVGIFKLGGFLAANSKVSYNTTITTTDAGKVTVVVDDDYDCPERALQIQAGYTTRNLTFNVGETNADSLVGNNVIVYVAKATAGRYEIKAIEVDNDSTQTLTIKASDLNDSALNWNAASPYVRYYKEGVTSGDGTKITLASANNVASYSVTWNNNDTANAAYLASNLKSSNTAVIEFIDTNSDNKYDIVNVIEYKHLIAETVDAEKGVIETYSDDKIDLAIEDEDKIVTIKDIDGNSLEIDDIEEGDVLAMIIKGATISPSVRVLRTANYSALDIIVLKDSTVTGKVMAVDPADNTVKIGDNEYDVDALAYNYNKVGLQAEGTFYLGINGEIVGFEGDRVVSDNYGYIMSVVAPIGKNYDAEVSILGKDGTIVDYDLADTVKITNPDNSSDYVRVKTKDNFSAGVYGTVLNGTTWNSLFDGSDSLSVAWGETGSFRLELSEAFANEMDDASYNTNALKAAEAAKRLVIFKANSNGEITEIIPASTTLSNIDDSDLSYKVTAGATGVETIAKAPEYDAGSNKLGSGNYLTDDAVIFDIDYSNPERSKVVSVGYFVDESKYAAVLYNKNTNSEFDAAVIIASDTVYGKNTGVAIVMSKSEIMDDEDNELIEITAVQDGAEVKLIFSDDSTHVNSTGVAADSYDIGTVFEYAANDAGEVTKYTTIGNIDWSTSQAYEKEFKFDTLVATDTDYTSGYGYFYGYIDDIVNNDIHVEITGSKATGAPSALAVGNVGEFNVSGANQYSVTGNNKKNTTIYNGDFEVGNVDKADYTANGKRNVYYVLVRTYEGEVIDVVSFDTSAIEVTPTYTVSLPADTYQNVDEVKAAIVVTRDGVVMTRDYSVNVTAPTAPSNDYTIKVYAEDGTTQIGSTLKETITAFPYTKS